MPAQPAPDMVIRTASTADVPAICRVYNPYVADTIVTFEEAPVPEHEMADRLDEVAAVGLPWLVAESGGTVLGYAYASRWKGRCAYRHSVEVTIYLVPGARGRGIGSLLYGHLLSALADRGLHVAIGGIALPNPASVALHEKFGFEQVAHFREVGFKLGRWIDVGYWQRMLA